MLTLRVVILAAMCLGAVGLSTPAQRAANAPPGPIVLPVERASNVFFVRATVNGVGPLWFTVDTGATLTVIDPSVAARIGKTPVSIGARPDVGMAPGQTELATLSGVRVEIPGLPPFTPPAIYVVPVEANGMLGHRIDGVLGTDVLRRYRVEFNYSAGTVAVTPPPYSGRPTDPGWPVTVDGNVLVAEATVGLSDGDNVPARLLVDTGSGGALTLTSPFVRQHRLIDRFYTEVGGSRSLAIGVNGVTTAPVIVLSTLAIGPAAWTGPRSSLSRETSGLSASRTFDGIIGAELLRRFTLTIDYPGKTMWLRSP